MLQICTGISSKKPWAKGRTNGRFVLMMVRFMINQVEAALAVVSPLSLTQFG